ncbi:DUF4376 domain-containing protein [Escherichia coli]|uniref:DUF4376 domain-containing protein n=1 Tax=Escherichia coli TaxID=562 RepID=UPI0007750FE9|nr:DUF4376 domain-containing protein [Escherichia coli]KXP62114.1 hypothetical protein AUP84_20155 [Escherichia coli]
MIYAYVKAGVVINWPVTEEVIRHRGQSVLEYTPVVSAPAPASDPVRQSCVEVTPVFVNGVLTQQWRVETLPRARLVENLLNELAGIRWQRETGGLELSGMKVLTDRESQAQLTGAWQSLQAGLISETEWKAADGWMRVTLKELEPVARAVAVHVAKCFAAEKQVSELITGSEHPETLDTVALFDAAYAA